jgi:pimeloyl-ACP methyl ester carboxylesterase
MFNKIDILEKIVNINLLYQRIQKRRALVEAHNKGQLGVSYASRICAEEIPECETIRLYPTEGKIPVDTEGVLVMLHGCGVDASQSSTMRKWIRLFGEKETSRKNMMWTQKHILRYENYTRLAVEAIDLPGHGVGPSLCGFQMLEQVVIWLGTYLKQKKAAASNKPLFVITRSSSAIFPAAVNRQYPGVIDGMVFVSPSFPGEPEIIAQEVAAARENVRRGVYGAVNEEGITWIEMMLQQADWGHGEDFWGVPILILTAAEDIEVVDPARAHFKKMANKLPNVTYHEFNSECHDFLSCEDAARRGEALRGLQLIQDMFKRIVKKGLHSHRE